MKYRLHITEREEDGRGELSPIRWTKNRLS